MDNQLRNIFQEELGISISSVLLPKKGTDMTRWATVACDQYTSEPEYWESVDAFVGENPSTLRMIFPEAYLETETEDQKALRIERIRETMTQYINHQMFEELTDTVLLTERTFKSGLTRHGLIFAVDLERYDYNKGSQSLIRATEGTIIERLPPRIRIRENAPLELPHIMILIDDAERTVIEPLVKKTGNLDKVYDFELMMDSGSIKGWKVSDETDLSGMAQALLKLKNPELFKKRYQLKDDYGVLLFAVGDGNHSLATAKACWENLKKNLSAEEQAQHPARYALVEVVNVHDSGLVFEPIHRVLFNVDPSHLAEAFCNFYNDKGCKASVVKAQERPQANGHIIPYTSYQGSGYLVVECPAYNLDVATLQNFLDIYLKENKQVGIDYVHGEDVTERLGHQAGNMGFFLAPMDKNELFKTVILDGALPRKTFSMGEAAEKRFYLECRRIR
jgi:hypothetical protein